MENALNDLQKTLKMAKTASVNTLNSLMTGEAAKHLKPEHLKLIEEAKGAFDLKDKSPDEAIANINKLMKDAAGYNR